MEVVHQKVEQGVLTPANAAPGGVGPYSTSLGAAHPVPAPPAIPDHQLLKCIGWGSYGEVWLARNIMGVFRAIKIVYRASFDSDRPYNREFEGLKKFEPISRSHQSQVDVLHVGQGDGYFYYVMELADNAGEETPKSEIRNPTETRKPNAESAQPSGAVVNSDFGTPSGFGLRNSDLYIPRTLKLELQRRGRLPFAESVSIGLALTTALEHLHENGLIHRDIKPANIIFVDGLPKLADIGLVAAVDATCSFVGTEGYLPPEGPGTPQADLYSLGKVLYELSTGKERRDFPELPLNLDSPEQTKGMMELNAVVLKACKPRPEDRYQSAGEMHNDLLLLLAGRSVRRTHDLERRLAMAKRIAAATVAVLVLGVVPYFVAIREARQARLEASFARTARAEVAEKLSASYLAQAQAKRWSHEGGHRFEGLELLKKAAQIGPSLVLRNEAIALLALPDLRAINQWSMTDQSRIRRAFDLPLETCALSDEKGNITVSRVEDGEELTKLPGFGHPILNMSFSSSSRLLSALYDGETKRVRIWDLKTKEVVLEPAVPGDGIVHFTHDERRIAIINPASIIIHDMRTGSELKRIPFDGKGATLTFDPQGHRLAAHSSDHRTVQIFDVETGQILHSLEHGGGVEGLGWSPSGGSLATACLDGRVYLWDATTGELRNILARHPSAAIKASFSYAGDLLTSTDRDRQLRLWDPALGREICRLGGAEKFCRFTPGDRGVICRDAFSRTVQLFEVATGRECRLFNIETTSGAEPKNCAFSSDGQVLATLHSDALRFWKVRTGEQLPGDPNAVDTFSLAVPDSGEELMINLLTSPNSNDRDFETASVPLRVPHLGTKALSNEVTVEFWQNVLGVRNQSTFSLDSFTYANVFNAHVPYGDGKVYWDFGNITTNGGRLSYTPPAPIVGAWQHFALVASQTGNYMRIYRNGVLEASKSGMTAFSGGNNDDLIIGGGSGGDCKGLIDEFRVWDYARDQGQIKRDMERPLALPQPGLLAYWRLAKDSEFVSRKLGGRAIVQKNISSVALGSRGFGVNPKTSAVEAFGGVESMTLKSKSDERLLLPFKLAALNHDRKWCAAASGMPNSVYILDARTCEKVRVLPASTPILSLGFSPNSHWLAVSGADEYRFFETGSWRLACVIPRQGIADILASAAFSPDSRMAAVACSPQTVRLLDPATGREYATLESREPQNISSLAFGPDGSQLAATTLAQYIQLWDLRLIRNELAALNLDWQLPPYPSPSNSQFSGSPMEWGVR